jgi:8-oxo-dGTP pyrophosphatase MutT (NUDIX family)
MNVQFDPRFETVRGALAAADTPVAEAIDHAGGRLEAAVALVLRGGPSFDFLLIKRATSERDPWSGQMALPGGRWETTDSGLLHTARRETLEETGLNLEALGVPLGRLPDVVPASPHIRPLRIAPYVFGVPASAEARIASHEVHSVHWVPVATLNDEAARSEIRIERPGFNKKFPSYHVVGEHVWGLTYGILSRFLELTPTD